MSSAVQKRLTSGDLLLFATGVIGLALYVFLLPTQHPDAAASYALGEGAAEGAATAFLARHGYAVDGLEAAAELRRYTDLLDGLQAHYGRSAARALLATDAVNEAPAYYWRVTYKEVDEDGDTRDFYTVGVTLEGEVWRFENDRPDDGAPLSRALQRVNREALVAALSQNDIEAAIDLSTLPDSVFTSELFFDFEAASKRQADTTSTTAGGLQSSTIRAQLLRGESPPLGRAAAAAMASHYLNRLKLQTGRFVVDSVWVLPEREDRVAAVHFSMDSSLHGQQVNADVQVSSAGGLRSLEVDFDPPDLDEGLAGEVANVLQAGLYVLMVIILVVSFFRRLVGRLIDARPALVDALVFGLLFGVWFALGKWEGELDFGGDAPWVLWVGRLFLMSLLGAMAGLLIFLLSSATDSITRALWDKKLAAASLIRQGSFRNALVGTALLRGVGLAFVLLGVMVLLLFFFPQVRLGLSERFLQGESWQPMVGKTFWAAWKNYVLVLLVLLGAGSYFYGRKNRAWMAVGAIAVFFTILQGVPLDVQPTWYAWGFSAVLGGALGLAFWYYDLVVCFVGLFLAQMVSSLSEGWLIEGSPVWVDSLLGGLFLLSVVVLGLVGLFSRPAHGGVKEYVPDYIKAITREERLHRELEIAHQVQASFLPRTMPQMEGLDLAGMCLPALEVGGDYYDFVKLSPKRLAMVVGDVSGKGIQAAFYMTLTKGFLRALCRDVESPAEVLRRLNTLFCENVTPGTFISMIYGVIDTEARTFTFARAGHNPVILKRSPSQESELIQPAGMAIGLISGARFNQAIEEVCINLRVGDALVFYTDGFSEAMNRARDLYGDERLAQKVSHVGQRTAGTILRIVTEDVHHFIEGAGRHDDMTMVVAKLSR